MAWPAQLSFFGEVPAMMSVFVPPPYAVMQVTKQGSALHEDASLKLLREFRNEVERWQWRGVAFSNDDEHIVGASNAQNEHIMYVWNAVVGNLERILEGTVVCHVAFLSWHHSCAVQLSVSCLQLAGAHGV